MPSEYELLPRNSSDLDDHAFKDKPVRRRHHKLLKLPLSILKKSRRVCRPIYIFVAFVAFFLWQISFNASYTNPPPFALHPSEAVYIAANIIDGALIKGPWGASLLDLVDTIGKDRVYVSIYGGPTEALKQLESLLECDHSIVSEEEHPIELSSIPHTKLPTGEERIKRIAYLAEVRNMALQPLNTMTRHFDKVLFINDVFFSPEDATRLLWGTHLSTGGKAEYKAACAADFVTSWKYYDTYGTRDFDGYSIGVPIFPWFANDGDAVSRKDVLAGRDAVRVKSCWGGMVAFDARYFQKQPEARSVGKRDTYEHPSATAHPTRQNESPSIPLRFRSEPEPFWDSSECCLIHADILALPPFPTYSDQVTRDKPLDWDDGIFMNPFVRVSYDAGTYGRIWIVKRFERLFALPQAIINHFAHMPRFNYRRTEREGDVVEDKIWISTEGGKETRELKQRATLGSAKDKEYWAGKGHYEDFERVATRGGYCGVRQLLVLKEGNTDEGNWDNLLSQVPPLDI